MRIGYACLTLGVRDTNFKTTILKNASDENLLSIIKHNLDVLDKIIDYNIDNNINLFRISSDIIPFGSSPVNLLKWWNIFEKKFISIGAKINNAGMRVSMHPGQYTVLNSPNEDVVFRAIKDLEYHNRFLDSLNVNKEHKIILHIGGVYGDKKSAIHRFIENYKTLDSNIKQRLVIENDDKSYNIEDVLGISKELNIPVIYDNLHNSVLPTDASKSDKYWIDKVRETWTKGHGPQKTHYSQQDKDKRAGAHSFTIKLEDFMNFAIALDNDLDIMLEVKDKNLSAVKCINARAVNNIEKLELEWSKYKYTVLENSPINYNNIRELLKDKKSYPVNQFYKLIEDSLEAEDNIGNSVNAAQHIWGYFKNLATEVEKRRFDKLLDQYQNGTGKKQSIKNHLNKLAIKYNSEYLQDSYYFYI
ncbi:MAG: UV DNA damage repair endonuclease UvsE [Tissierellia bacterium]|nr:UV DNA damage repair endonuclease UvsE [Tissierellia bacterium]